MPESKKLFLVCTETSGDLLGARLVHELRNHMPDLEITGVAGPRLEAEGMKPLYRVSDFNVMGLFEVLSQLKRLKGIFRQLVEHVQAVKPDLILLIDAPDFNMRFAKAVQGMGIPVVYYVSPQVWAWRKSRSKQIADMVDHIMLLFSFEREIYDSLGLPNTWVGHPLVDELQSLEDRATFLKQNGLREDKPLVALAPGSRSSEVKRLLPVMVEVAKQRVDAYQFALPLAPSIDEAQVREIIGDFDGIKLLPGQMRPLMRHAEAAVVASGTATLETGLLQTPMVVGYRMKTFSYWLARLLVKIPHIAMVNIVLGKRVVPELIQYEFNPNRVVEELDQLIGNQEKRAAILADFARLPDILGGGGAADRAAEVVWGFLQK